MKFKSKNVELHISALNLLWYKDFQIHREYGPAVFFLDFGDCEWRNNGDFHRLDGPAVISGDSSFKEWWEYGTFISNEVK
jgi:hypothetical protein